MDRRRVLGFVQNIYIYIYLFVLPSLPTWIIQWGCATLDPKRFLYYTMNKRRSQSVWRNAPRTSVSCAALSGNRAASSYLQKVLNSPVKSLSVNANRLSQKWSKLHFGKRRRWKDPFCIFPLTNLCLSTVVYKGTAIDIINRYFMLDKRINFKYYLRYGLHVVFKINGTALNHRSSYDLRSYGDRWSSYAL